jgi:hypothetical protein
MTFEEIADALGARVATLQPETYTGDDAAELAEVGARITKLGETMTMLLARRAASTGAWRARSSAASVEQWLAAVSGASEGAAREALVTASRLDALPQTADAVRAGALSIGQAAHVTAAAAIDPDAEAHLLDVASKCGLRGLREEKERVIAASTDEARAHEIAVRERHLRTCTRGLATHGSFSGPSEQVAGILAALEPLRRQAFEHARSKGKHESQDAYRFDALAALAAHTGPAADGKATAPVTRLRVGLSRLLGEDPIPGEEMCEIPGVGPVPVVVARRALPHGLFELVISDGVDVRTVVSSTRHVPKALKIAIEERDQGRCKIRDCDRTLGIERHHVLPFGPNGITSYEVLGDVCPDHHDLITYKSYAVIDNNDGTWSLRAPPSTNAA